MPLLANGITELRHAASRRSFVADLRRFVPELSAADVLRPRRNPAQALDRDGRLVDDFIVHGRSGRCTSATPLPRGDLSLLALAC